VRRSGFIFLLILISVASLNSQTEPVQHAQPPDAHRAPQTARQALIEMFTGKDPDAFEKHLPQVARQTLIRKGETPETSTVQRIANIGRQMIEQGEHLETFDAGPMLLAMEQRGANERIEVMVERDSLMGEVDEIELSIRSYKNGESEFLPVVPQLTFSLTQEKEVWRLSEVTVAAHMPLTDPEYLKGLRKEQDQSLEQMASSRVNFMVTAETNYSAAHPDRGFTCSLSDLFGQQDSSDAPDPSAQSQLPDWLSGDSSGYRFTLSGCQGSHSTRYRVTAVPSESEPGLKAFCANESGTLRFAADGKGPGCLSHGQVLNPPTENSPPPVD